MVHKATDPQEVFDILSVYREHLTIDRLTKWMNDKDNFVVATGEGSIGMFEDSGNGIYNGHHFHLADIRGRKALNASKSMIDFVWDNFPAVKTMRGYSPLDRRDARWAARQLGFTSLGALPTLSPPCELFVLFRPIFKDK